MVMGQLFSGSYGSWVTYVMNQLFSCSHGHGLLQTAHCQLICLPVTASAVGLERRRSADLRLTTLRPCVQRADQPTMAAHSAAHPV